MTEALALPGMRILDSEIGPVIPIRDIAELIGIDDSTISKKIKAFEKWLSPCSVFIPLPTSGGTQRFRCLNRKGFDRILLLIRPKKTGEESIDRLFGLRELILEKMGADSTEIVQVPGGPSLEAELREAGSIAEVCRKAPESFQAAVLEKHGKVVLAKELRSPAVVHGESGWYNPSGLVKLCNDPDLTPERLNWYLANNPRDPSRRPFQYRDENKLWRLTPLGSEHGREYPFNLGNGHSEPRIAWRESVLYASGLKRHIPNDQLVLPAAAGRC